MSKLATRAFRACHRVARRKSAEGELPGVDTWQYGKPSGSAAGDYVLAVIKLVAMRNCLETAYIKRRRKRLLSEVKQFFGGFIPWR